MRYASDIKILFLIINTTSCLVPGVFLFANGVGAEIFLSQSSAPKIVAGLLFIALAALGYCGAITQNRKQLNTYWIVLLVPVGFYLVGLVLLCGAHNRGLKDLNVLQRIADDCMTMISHMVVMLVSVGLGLTLAVHARADPAVPGREPLGGVKYAFSS